MGLVEYLLIAVGAVAAAFFLVAIVRRISVYYRQQHHMSVWAGVFLLAIAVVMTAYSFYHYGTWQTPLVIAAGAMLLITGILDMIHAGVGMGFLALLFQMVLSAFFIVVIVVAVALYVFRALRRGDDLVLDAVTGTTGGVRNGLQLFFRFFIP